MRAYFQCLLVWGCLLGVSLRADQDRISIEDLKSDFDHLYHGLQEAHFDLFVNMPKTQMDREFQARRDAITAPMTANEARIYFQRFVALGKIAHANIDLPIPHFFSYLGDGGVVFPLDLKHRDGAYYVTANDSGHPGIQDGDKLTAINQIPMTTWFQKLSAYLSADTETMMHGFFETRLIFLLWLELGAVKQFDVTVTNPTEGQRTLTIQARDRTFMQQQSAQRQGRLALDPGRVFRMEPNAVAYLRPGPFHNIEGDDTWDVTSFQKFIDDAFTQIRTQSARALVIDLRDNTGGSNSFSDVMLAPIATRPFRFCSSFDVKVSKQTIAANRARLSPDKPDSISARYDRAFAEHKPGQVFPFEIQEAQPRQKDRFSGPVYLLINRHSYSNAVFVAAIVQDYGFGTVVGEETNDLATTYGAMEHFTLPKTGIPVGYPKAHMVRPNGDDTIRGVVPDIAIPTPLIETDDDPVLTRLYHLIETRHKTPDTAQPAKRAP